MLKMSKRITIVIPMAGQGSRFLKAGWEVPKPLISFAGKMMIEHVMDAFPEGENFSFVLVCREDFFAEYPAQMRKLTSRQNVRCVIARGMTQGAACSVLLARKYFRNRSLLVADSDTFYDKSVLEDFIRLINERNPDLGVVTFKSKLDCYSYISLDKCNKLDKIAEKRVISNHAISGVYYFSSANEYEEEIIDAMIYGDRDRGEFYLSKIFGNVAKANDSVVLLHEIDPKNIFCTGTPGQLDEVLTRISKK